MKTNVQQTVIIKIKGKQKQSKKNREMISTEEKDILQVSWSDAWASKEFRIKLITGWILYIAVLLYYPHFFLEIQKKPGVLLNDFVLACLPSVNMSFTIFGALYITVIFTIYRSAQSPYLFLLYLWSTLLLSFLRIITITCVPLEPPAGLVPLVDPILFAFYGPNNITKDLFFSGHMSSIFLVYLILRKKKEKVVASIAAIVVGVSLLLQHIHYTVDVITAPLFVYFVFIAAKKIALVYPVNYVRKFKVEELRERV